MSDYGGKSHYVVPWSQQYHFLCFASTVCHQTTAHPVTPEPTAQFQELKTRFGDTGHWSTAVEQFIGFLASY